METQIGHTAVLLKTNLAQTLKHHTQFGRKEKKRKLPSWRTLSLGRGCCATRGHGSRRPFPIPRPMQRFCLAIFELHPFITTSNLVREKKRKKKRKEWEKNTSYFASVNTEQPFSSHRKKIILGNLKEKQISLNRPNQGSHSTVSNRVTLGSASVLKFPTQV